MGRYVLRRVLQLIPVWIAISMVVFGMMNLLPGDPAYLFAGPDATERESAQIRDRLGLNAPVHVRYGEWILDMARGDFGRSISTGQPISDILMFRGAVTAQLAILAIIVAATIGIVTGVVAAINRNSWIDQSVMSLAMIGISIPNFWAAMILILIFSKSLGWLPSVNFAYFHEDWQQNLLYMVMPVLAVGLTLAAEIARITRSSTLEVLPSDFVRTARAKGLHNRAIILKHVVRPGLIPVVTVIGLNFGVVLAGAIVTETVYNIPGIGQQLVRAIIGRDYPVVQAIIVFIAFVYVAVNLIVDLLYYVIDPRIQYK